MSDVPDFVHVDGERYFLDHYEPIMAYLVNPKTAEQVQVGREEIEEDLPPVSGG